MVRLAIPHADALDGFRAVCAASPLPVVADVHFDHRLAIEAARGGAAKLRINPGNIGSLDRFDAVLEAAGEVGIPVRIGVNAGSLAPEYDDKDWELADKLVASAVSFCEHAESRGFSSIVVSAKASSVPTTVAAYRKLSEALDYPLHLGVTEAGTLMRGTVKSAVGLGILLDEGIGDTLRVSLTADPVEEVGVAWDILAALDLRRLGPELVSCPTCGRCEVDLIGIAEEVSRRLRDVRTPIKVAVMGCVVNGPGESRDADIGVAAGKGVGIIFVKGLVVRKVPEDADRGRPLRGDRQAGDGFLAAASPTEVSRDAAVTRSRSRTRRARGLTVHRRGAAAHLHPAATGDLDLGACPPRPQNRRKHPLAPCWGPRADEEAVVGMAETEGYTSLGKVVVLAGVGINLCLGVLYTWSMFTSALTGKLAWTAAEALTPYAIALGMFGLTMVFAGQAAGPHRSARRRYHRRRPRRCRHGRRPASRRRLTPQRRRCSARSARSPPRPPPTRPSRPRSR